MIVRPKTHWFLMLFVWRGSVLQAILPQLAVVLAVSSIVTWKHGTIDGYAVPLTAIPFTLLGASSYDRYWEGRRLWGTMLNVTRSLARQCQSLVHLKEHDVRMLEFLGLLSATVHGLKHQLRHTDPQADFERCLSSENCEELKHLRLKTAVITVYIGRWIASRRKEGQIGEFTAATMDQTVSILCDTIGGCERIASTPLPFAYTVMVHRTVYLYCLLLPFALVGSIGPMTPILSILIAYTFLALEALAQEIEDPFGIEDNDLALEHMSWLIEQSLREMCGEPTSLPPPPIQEWVLS
jgi:putative membrane protein